jgi:transcriptional regulator with XRE-family HTH domain
MKAGREKFGTFLWREREAKEIWLREMAKKIGVSPTYLSKVERDEFPPPTEDKVRKITGILELDADELLTLTGRVASSSSFAITLKSDAASDLRSGPRSRHIECAAKWLTDSRATCADQ